MVSVALESIVRRNTHLLNGIPVVGQGLAGVVEQDNKRLELSTTAEKEGTPTKESHVHYQKVKHEESSSRSEEEKKVLAYHRKLVETFTEEELTTIIHILGLFSEEKTNIEIVYQMLLEAGQEEQKHTS